jgi:hypothetical protein
MDTSNVIHQVSVVSSFPQFSHVCVCSYDDTGAQSVVIGGVLQARMERELCRGPLQFRLHCRSEAVFGYN